MTRIILATMNRGKVNEIQKLISGKPYEMISMKEAGISVAIVEDGTTFEENALIKADTISKLAGGIVIADDSGLVVDSMGGEPGIYSARFLGESATDEERCTGILKRLEGVPDEKRTARFVCAAAAVSPNFRITVMAAIEGIITREPTGSNGFGYDPIFYVPETGLTMAQMDSETKNRLSHRGKAFRALFERLSKEESIPL